MLVLALLGTMSLAGGGTPAAAITVRPLSAMIDAGGSHNCAVLDGGDVRCWGSNTIGQLGYGIPTQRVGVDETPGSVGPVSLDGLAATAISAGTSHTCVILEDGNVRCWGDGTDGRLGYGNENIIGDDEVPDFATVGNVDLGPNRTAEAISAGGAHTCAILDTGLVRCWGQGRYGQLGYGNENDIGDDEVPDFATVGNVNLGGGRTATAIAAGTAHTCVILDNGKIRCWGLGGGGRLGYGNENDIGDDEVPDFATVGNVELGSGRTAVDITAGHDRTCAILDNGQVRCWGVGSSIGTGSPDPIGDDEYPNQDLGNVDLGGAGAINISAGLIHTCATLSTGATRCWGGGLGLGLGDPNLNIGDVDLQGAAQPRPATAAIAAGSFHTCAVFDDGGALCWGSGDEGALGRGNGIEEEIGDNESPGPRSNIVLGGTVRRIRLPIF
jgi:alpha-tubulin suppressor-like RCC1 family protein